MSHAGFVHLRVHTAYSLSEGAIRVKELAALCRDGRMPAVAITDSSNLFGAMEFSEAMAKAGVQPIIGCQLALRSRNAEPQGRSHRHRDLPTIVLLAQDETGYANLLKLSTKAFLETEPTELPQVDFADIVDRGDGLICLTGGANGPLGHLLADNKDGPARQFLERMAAAFPDRLYVEIQRHGMPEEMAVEERMLELAFDTGLPLVATNECYFTRANMYEAHDALRCIAGGTYVGVSERDRLTPEHYFKSADEMAALFDDLPEAIENSLVIARRCAVAAPKRSPILPNFTDDGSDEGLELENQARRGLEGRLREAVFTDDMDAAAREAAAVPYWERFDYELGIIRQMGFSGYFLIVSDFIKWAKAHGIPVGPGRGSGAGSVIAWSLTITDLDPLRFGLLFERFLNPERISMPDFDIDFCQDRRDEVIDYVQQKYGRGNVAQIITFGKLQARAALRDVGRVLELGFGRVDRICKMVPNNPANPVTLAEALEIEPRLKEEKRNDEGVARLIETAQKLEGLYRHASTHAAGVVIGDRPLEELVPLYRDPRSDMPVTQFSMKYAEAAGLVKFDFLGLKTLTVLDRARKLLEQREIKVDLAALPLDDKATYAMLGRGETVGVFQLESSGMRDVLRQMRPDVFEEIIALVALYRPGPMDNIPKYIACKFGQEQPDYLHPWLEKLLKETYGVIIYQEQVLEIAKILAGYSLGEADILRKAMGKKIKEEMDAQRERFVSGAAGKGVPKQQASSIFDQVAKFAGYGFNKAHSACYALIAYQTAWLKANYPVEFMAASMSLDLNNTDKLNIFRQELDRSGIEVRSPDINRSGVEFSVEFEGETGAVRYALAAIKNVGREAMAQIVAERERGGPFRSIADFASRVDPGVINKRQLENLIRAGAFDGLNANRTQLLAGADLILRHAGSCASERAAGQTSLFGGGPAEESQALRLPDVPPASAVDQLRDEFDAVGFYLSAHPLDAYAETLAKLGTVSAAALPAVLRRGEASCRIAGAILGKQERRSARGTPFAFVQLSDPTGAYEVTVFSEVLEEAREIMEVGQSVVLHVDGKSDGEQIRLTATRIQTLDGAAAQAGGDVALYLANTDPLPAIARLLQDTGGGRNRVFMVLDLPEDGTEVRIKLPQPYAISPQIRQALKTFPGVRDLREA
ncbi:DNA polymerase III subunit alpha [Oceanibacterium hippocampi]|uniref:DNA polymerase III subunit alpha n=1 Tax=Oceanibacterium hippocampi TaxID=745714 RepID=A0A1Y5T1R1_9PROT|nr:DNA polymerase III subunit alpha [Oceanibacterium hippocampi]